jgi:hypothetical protein
MTAYSEVIFGKQSRRRSLSSKPGCRHCLEHSRASNKEISANLCFTLGISANLCFIYNCRLDRNVNQINLSCSHIMVHAAKLWFISQFLRKITKVQNSGRFHKGGVSKTGLYPIPARLGAESRRVRSRVRFPGRNWQGKMECSAPPFVGVSPQTATMRIHD